MDTTSVSRQDTTEKEVPTTADTTRSTIWVDSSGKTRQTILRGNATLAPVALALAGQSNGDFQRDWEGATVVNPAPAPINATYNSVNDYASLVFTTAAGNLVYVTLPCPVSTIFLADQETVDPVAIATIIAAVVGTVIDGSGAVVTAFVGGFRRSSGREYQ